jgi:hypothetical protein
MNKKYYGKDRVIKILGFILFLGSIGLCGVFVFISRIMPLSGNGEYYEYLYSIYSCFSPHEYKFISSSTPHLSIFRSSYEILYVIFMGGGLLLLSFFKLKYRYLFYYFISLLGCISVFLSMSYSRILIINQLIVLSYFIIVFVIGAYIHKNDNKV